MYPFAFSLTAPALFLVAKRKIGPRRVFMNMTGGLFGRIYPNYMTDTKSSQQTRNTRTKEYIYGGFHNK